MGTLGDVEANEASVETELDPEVVRAEAATLGIELGQQAPVVTGLAHNPLNRVTGGLHRVTWSNGRAARKHLTRFGDGAAHWAPSTDPRHFNYWAREAEIYRSELPRRLGLGAPGLLGAIDQPDGSVVLWLEWVDGATGLACGIDGLAAAGRALGRSQGRPLAELPDDDFLSSGFIDEYARSKPVDYGLLDDDDAWAHPVTITWPDTLRADCRRMHHERQRWIDILAALPRTVAHLDVWPNNIVGRADGTVTFLDWAFTGSGALGEDIGNMIPDAVLDLLIPAADLDELERRVFAAYIDGLREVGWKGDADEVRLAMMASAVKYVWLVPLLLAQRSLTNHHAYGRPIDAATLYRERGVALAKLADWGRKALDMAG